MSIINTHYFPVLTIAVGKEQIIVIQFSKVQKKIASEMGRAKYPYPDFNEMDSLIAVII
jgi:hypothetical protein